MVAASAMMMWKGLGVLTNGESPIVVVLRYCLYLPFKVLFYYSNYIYIFGIIK